MWDRAYECNDDEFQIANRIEKEKFLPLGEISGFEKNLFSGIISNAISCDHIPESHEEANHYSKARMIILATAFDWAFAKLYPDGISHSEQSIAASEQLKKLLRDVAENNDSSSRVRKEAKRLIKIIDAGDSYSSMLLHFEKNEPELFKKLGDNLYNTEEMPFDSAKIADRTNALRNALAHGNQDFSIDLTVLVDTIFLERIVLALQLLYLDVSPEEVVKLVLKAR